MYLEPHEYRIYYVNIDLRHQYVISTAESQTFLLAKRSQRRSLRTADVFLVVASLPPKVFFGGREATTGNTSAVRRLPAAKSEEKRVFSQATEDLHSMQQNFSFSFILKKLTLATRCLSTTVGGNIVQRIS